MKNSSWAKLRTKFTVQKTLLLILIAATSIFPVMFVDIKEPTASLVIFKLLAKAGSLCGTTLIVWQFLLGFRTAAGKIIRDFLWVLDLHKKLGKYILMLVSLHPIFISLYYLEKNGTNPLLLQGDPLLKWWVLAGEIAFAIFLAIVLTSVLWRTRLGRTKWYTIHISSYLAIAIVLAHGFAIGTTISTTAVYNFWIILTTVMAGFFVFRVICRAGLMSSKHKVTKVEKVGPDVTRITCKPIDYKIEPRLGQFIYFRRGLLGKMRPFTVSHYEPFTGEVSVTVKAIGTATQKLQSIQPGETVHIDGPYGVFSQEAMETMRPIVMIAGGIGITSFTRLFEELAYEPDREIHLFYGNQKKHEIVYKEELENVQTVDVIHVLSDEPQYPGETGYITTDLLKKHLHRPLSEYEFLICGPPEMIEKIEGQLLSEDLPRTQIHHELFGY